MDANQITYFSYMGGGVLFALFTLTLTWLWQRKATHFTFVTAALVSTVWLLLIATHYNHSALSLGDMLIIEICRYAAWITAILAALKFATGQELPKKFFYAIHSLWAVALTFILLLNLFSASTLNDSSIFIWVNLLLSIVCLISVEQLYKNGNSLRIIKLYSLVLGSIFAYDIFLFAYSLIFNVIDVQLWQARGAINGCSALLMTIGALTLSTPSATTRIAISRPAAFYSTSMTVSGAFLAIMATGGYYLQLYGGTWSNVLSTLIIFFAIICTVTLFISQTLRSRLNVWINKHFFRHKYDYRVEWLKLINALSRPSDNQDFQLIAVQTLASIFKSPKGGLWRQQDKTFTLAASYQLELPSPPPSEPVDSEFCHALKEHEWVFSPRSPDQGKISELNALLPEWIAAIPDLWLVVPLLTEKDLLGFIILTEPEIDTDITWEDLDLLKTVGRQVASYLDRHQAAELLAESRQFDAFNKLSAFVMHDLKNLIAQQALVVENAAKHKDNPAFIEDAINTIDNSVTRMHTLLRKLQQDEPSEYRTVDLDAILVDVIKKCQPQKPMPSIHRECAGLKVSADPDSLLMTLVHIVKNAQDATSHTGFIDVTLVAEENFAIITVEDNGSGMSQDFINNYFFKPFATTKSGKGMGIGVYQTKTYIESIGGTVAVESTEGSGTRFTVRIPTVKA
ncbi:XrtA/PEP-CTERM system histidine kinase PrsK [Dasania marina]|uniref:XrtA/PEP-CTERM system histidine kinase PrsK n=1 Tax=Dasania marina TaxID=471499 RepID=UPI0030D9473D|tara:strand:- start:108415 stop:110460 length:2046 start_codon:yes stop_codon:yes gene_type:complete